MVDEAVMVIEYRRDPDRQRVDPRERREAFQRLDEGAQALVRDQWATQGRDPGEALIEGGWRRDLCMGAILVAGTHALVVLVLVHVLRGLGEPHSLWVVMPHLFVAAVFGLGLGAVWRLLEVRTFGGMMSAACGVFLFEIGGGFNWLFALLAALIAGFGGNYIGDRRQEWS